VHPERAFGAHDARTKVFTSYGHRDQEWLIAWFT
jgi:hypothetical protein